jgi:hypothetical protein
MNDPRDDEQSQEGRQMTTRKTVGAVVAGLVLSSALVSGALARGTDPTMPQGPTVPWTEHIKAMDAALRVGDVGRAQTEWREAYGAALGSRRWEGFADAGDAVLRLGRASGAPAAGVPRARELYLAALFRARDTGSLDGVLRVADSFKGLGDRDVTMAAVRMADRLAAKGASPSQRAQLAMLSAGRPMTTASSI